MKHVFKRLWSLAVHYDKAESLDVTGSSSHVFPGLSSKHNVSQPRAGPNDAAVSVLTLVRFDPLFISQQ